ncbi:glycosyltransferase A (GT-A) superfamily protein (DUF2064 family) [Salinibacterium sp. CAN_S4]|uniref:TIGR04282 family arsenosugar biosynthesis glycosyltransferase n=1 Tax=Salinibacterium sp. CAN_S4 TaxID=2787727 RepID=UPI0018EF56EE
MTTLVLIAKEPLPGKAKTRLHPPLTLEQAATLAAAAIDDTLRAMESLPATRRILLFDGNRLPERSESYDVTGQTTGTLDLRLGAIFDECDEPMLLIGMDTPQLTSDDLAPAFGGWPIDEHSGVDAWFGPAGDGGFWALGMREPRGDLIRGVEMSKDDTGAAQLARLHEAGLTVGTLPTLTDVDTIDSAREVAAIAPHTLFARTLQQFEQVTS